MLPIVTKQSPLANPAQVISDLVAGGINPTVARVLANRGIHNLAEATFQYPLLPHHGLKDIQLMVDQLLLAIDHHLPITVVADYDCDGATACSVAVSGLRALGATIDFVVPNRFIHGYGLTPSVVDLVKQDHDPKFILTVDNGISSYAGVDQAHGYGIKVLVTDHHLPAAGLALPQADVIVNPNQPGDQFASKNLAGVGVMFYVIIALAERLYHLGRLPGNFQIAELLDLVALGTVADVVKLDANNRWLVHHGLQRIHHSLCRPGIEALFMIAKKDPQKACSLDFGFALGPRLNAAGRLKDMTVGIQCLLSDNLPQALDLAAQLNDLNVERKAIEMSMKDVALDKIDLEDQSGNFSRVVYSPTFHEGVVGIVAGRIKEQDHVPTVVFAPAQETGVIKGSGRSIPGVHIRDVLDLVHKRHPQLILKFGGHAMAAGMSIREKDYPAFATAFELAVKDFQGGKFITQSIEVDGELSPGELDVETALSLSRQIWGQGFPEPIWEGEFQLLESRLLGKDKNHLKMLVSQNGLTWDAMYFFHSAPLPGDRVHLVYRLNYNEFNQQIKPQLVVVEAEEADPAHSDPAPF